MFQRFIERKQDAFITGKCQQEAFVHCAWQICQHTATQILWNFTIHQWLHYCLACLLCTMISAMSHNTCTAGVCLFLLCSIEKHFLCQTQECGFFMEKQLQIFTGFYVSVPYIDSTSTPSSTKQLHYTVDLYTALNTQFHCISL